jgi:general secretion pathway protein A
MTTPASIDPGFCADAFSLTPDPRRLFLSHDHAEALAGLKLGLEYRRGLMVVVGEVGMGKTTVAYSLLAALGENVRTAYIANTRLPFEALLRHALEDFGVECEERDRASLLSALKTFLLECATQDQIAVLVIDEAQSLDDDTFENLRLLSNVETYRQKLLQIILLGQPELDARLRQHQLRQIADRVGVRVNINPLDAAQSRSYIEHRLERSGGSLEMFSAPALGYIVRRARGVPRRMNILCHNALLLAYAAGTTQVSLSMAREAVRELKGGKVRRLVRRASPKPPIAQNRGPFPRSWAAAGAAVAAGALFLAIGLVHPPATPPDTGAATVPWTGAPEHPVPSVYDSKGAGAGHEPGVEVPRPVEAEAANPEPTPDGTQMNDDAAAAGDGTAEKTDASPEAGDGSDALVGPPMAAEGHAPDTRVVIVQRGTTLIAIARQVYGQDGPELIRRILEANPTVSNPDLIVAGSKLLLPQAPPTTRTDGRKGS